MAPRVPDITDQIFGRLRVVERVHVEGSNTSDWRCVCECGRRTIVSGGNLRKGNTRSCGCLSNESRAARRRTHGKSGPHRGYGKEYEAWQGIKRRCLNPKTKRFTDYGGRGIRVCDKWLHDFAAFLADVGPAPSNLHSIDRINNDGHYEPGNVRWATRKTQNNNKRGLRMLELHGRTQTAAAWANELGMSKNVLNQRLNAYGWSVEKALTTAVK